MTQLIKMIAYQKGAVVSRTVVKKDTGTVTLFSFAKGQGLSEHTAPFDALVYLVEGEAEITIAGKLQRAVKGDLVTLPANRPHALKAVKKFKMMLIMIKK
ncbi:MAG: cupin domain-containing protein [bacterium]|nr:cupin domain-containing protein [bacterium]MDD5353957.1 cupin domain-containing protein [bacterium]